MRDRPSRVVDGVTMNALPSSAYMAPRAKSACPPDARPVAAGDRLRGALAEEVDLGGGVHRGEAAACGR